MTGAHSFARHTFSGPQLCHIKCVSLPMQEIEQRCNEIIRGAHAVRQVTVDGSNRDRLASSPLLRGNLPPADSVRGVVRLIEIEGVDINACGGTHLRSTAELQVEILLVHTTCDHCRLQPSSGQTQPVYPHIRWILMTMNITYLVSPAKT